MSFRCSNAPVPFKKNFPLFSPKMKTDRAFLHQYRCRGIRILPPIENDGRMMTMLFYRIEMESDREIGRAHV